MLQLLSLAWLFYIIHYSTCGGKLFWISDLVCTPLSHCLLVSLLYDYQAQHTLELTFKSTTLFSQNHQPIYFHRRSSSTKGRFPPKVVFHQRLSSIKGHLPPKVVFHQRLSSTKGCLSPNVVFHRSLSSTKGRLPPTITPW